MNDTMTAPVAPEKPTWETPQIHEMSEREILNSFQLTQSMAGWWTTPTCC
jgi:hypothetical protein